LRELCGIKYQQLTELAPSSEMLAAYRKDGLRWDLYRRRYRRLLQQRRVEQTLDPQLFADAVLLCSEHDAQHCHRSIAARYLQRRWREAQIEIVHLPR